MYIHGVCHSMHTVHFKGVCTVRHSREGSGAIQATQNKTSVLVLVGVWGVVVKCTAMQGYTATQ